jgi:hypothetical protein
LRIVEQDDVARARDPEERGGVGGLGFLVRLTLVGGQAVTVRIDAVQQRVELLGHGEELGRALDHDPASVDPGAPVVRDQGVEQLRAPPPRAVEFTFQTTRPRSRAAARVIAWSNSFQTSGSSGGR